MSHPAPQRPETLLPKELAHLTPFQKLLLIRALRPECLLDAILTFIEMFLGEPIAPLTLTGAEMKGDA